jgi:hypothetical protein
MYDEEINKNSLIITLLTPPIKKGKISLVNVENIRGN